MQVTEDAGGLLVDTGPLRFRVPREGFLPVQDVVLAGGPAWPEPFAGFTMETDAAAADSSSGAVELEIDEAGPLRAVILVRGRHLQPDGTEFLTLRGRITAYAGKPFIEIEHQFLHTLDLPQVTLQSLRLDFAAPPAEKPPQLALGEGWYRTSITESDSEVSQTLDTETMLYQSNEHFIDSYYGDFWTDWRDEQGGLCLSIHQAHQNFPKRLHGHTQGIACWLYPAGETNCPDPAGHGQDPPHPAPLPRARYPPRRPEPAQPAVPTPGSDLRCRSIGIGPTTPGSRPISPRICPVASTRISITCTMDAPKRWV